MRPSRESECESVRKRRVDGVMYRNRASVLILNRLGLKRTARRAGSKARREELGLGEK